jgi:stage II sporulation protein D
VALDNAAAAASFAVIQGNYELIDGSTGLLITSAPVGNSWRITPAGTTMVVQGPGLNGQQPYQGPVVLREAPGASDACPNLFSYGGVQYRGNLVVQNLNNGLLVLNVLDIEHYLYGVVGQEMGGGASPEAYCAQAVASRSYALSMRGRNSWYDINTKSQAYGGYSSEAEFADNGDNPVVDAVRRTSGQVLEYKGTLVQAFFHANAGGYTEDVENVWGESLPYLRGVPSDGDAYADTLGGWAQSTYRWTKTCSRSDLGSRLGVGQIQDIQMSRNRTQVTGDGAAVLVPGTCTVSGRATQVTVVGSAGAKTFYRDGIRQPFGLPSTLFDVDLGGHLSALDIDGQAEALTGGDAYVQGRGGAPVDVSLGPGSVYIIGAGNNLVTQAASSDQITFTGRGDGHGVGMSQFGAIGMAIKGYKYQDILELYYNQAKYDGSLQIVGNYGQ